MRNRHRLVGYATTGSGMGQEGLIFGNPPQIIFTGRKNRERLAMTIKQLDSTPEGVLGIEFNGWLNAEDYREILLPILHQHVERYDGFHLLCVTGENFRGVSAGAVMQDILSGLRYSTRMCALALVTDIPWMRRMACLSRPLLLCPLRLFHADEMEKAKEWAARGLELHYELDRENSILTVLPQAPLAPEPLTRLSRVVEEHCAQHGQLAGMAVNARHFPFWQGIGGLRGHLRFLCRHRDKVRRVALVTDSPLARGAEMAAPLLLPLVVRHFPHGEMEAAREWILSAPKDAPPPASSADKKA